MSVEVTRRHILLTAGGALAASVALLSASTVEADTKPFSTSKREVGAISGDDPSFNGAVDALFPGLTSDPTFQKLAPLALLVTHKRGRAIRAFSALWTTTSASGTSEIPINFYVSLGSPATGHTLSALGSARKNILGRRQSRLVTPFFNWTPDFYRANPVPDWKTIIRPTEPGAFLASEMSNGAAISVTLDGVVFADWKRMGPDKHGLGSKVKIRRNAEHDEGLAVYKMMKSGATDVQIVQMLTDHGSAPRSSSADPKQLWYERVRKVHAQILLKAFHNSDRAAFTKALVRLKMRRKTIIKSVPA